MAAVRRQALAAARFLAIGGSKGARATGKAGAAAGRWLWPRSKALVISLALLAWRLLSSGVRLAWEKRKVLGRVGHRVAWWGALLILVWVGQALLAADGDPELVAVSVLWFGVGLSISVLVLLGAPETRMRVAAFALASGHGVLGALAWLVVGA